jgi:hypothetical protein
LRSTFDKLGVWSRLELAMYVASHGGKNWLRSGRSCHRLALRQADGLKRRARKFLRHVLGWLDNCCKSFALQPSSGVQESRKALKKKAGASLQSACKLH